MNSGDDSLFKHAQSTDEEPLASRMRPRTIAEYIGQDHIMGPGRLLRRAIQADQLSSVIFSGPPGTGKTTLARVVANSTKSEFVSLNAVLTGVAEIRSAIQRAQEQKSLYGRKTILFVDEVHRWNKSQQDALLPWVENGTVILIGATTENPYFEVNAALVSRSRVFQLKALTKDDLRDIALQAIRDPLRGYGAWKVEIDGAALDHLIDAASGDARSLLNALELAVETTPERWPPNSGATIQIDLAVAEESIQQRALLYDKEGDYHFDSISAFIKSIRGSDPDAALYWLARMVRSGESPRFVFRRMLISASEDIGLADPQALVVVQAAADAFDRVGMPEGQYFLSHAAMYLATTAKSNSTMAYFDALKALEQEDLAEVPNHLKDSNRDKKGFGHGEGYLYPHAYRDHWVAQTYLPISLRGKVFYQPSDQGWEASVKDQVLSRREIQLAEAKENEGAEHLTWSPTDDRLGYFLRRAESGGDSWLMGLKDKLFSGLEAPRHARMAIIGPSSTFLVPEAIRRVPEGLVYIAFGSGSEREWADAVRLHDSCDDMTRMVDTDGTEPFWIDGHPEFICACDLLTNASVAGSASSGATYANVPKELLLAAVPGVRIRVSERLPGLSSRLSEFAGAGILGAELHALIERTEKTLYAGFPDAESLMREYRSAGFTIADSTIETFPRKRRLSHATLEAWFASKRTGSYGNHLASVLGPERFSTYRDLIRQHFLNKEVEWPVHALLLDLVMVDHGQVVAEIGIE